MRALLEGEDRLNGKIYMGENGEFKLSIAHEAVSY